MISLSNYLFENINNSIFESSKSIKQDEKFFKIVDIMRKQKMKSDIWKKYNAQVAAAICNNDFENGDYEELKETNPKYIIYHTVDEDPELSDLVIKLIQDEFKVAKNKNDECVIFPKNNYSEYDGVKKLVMGYYFTNADIDWSKWLKDYTGQDKDNIIKKIYE